MGYEDLNEHIGTIVALLGVGWTIAAVIGWKTFWSSLTRIEKNQTAYIKAQADCQKELPGKYVLKADYETDNTEIWEAINHHGHNGGGRVTR